MSARAERPDMTLLRRIMAYWQHRLNTKQIAERVGLTEAEVYNILARRRGDR